MSILSFEVADRFVLRIIKSHTANPSRQWANSYEFAALTPGVLGDIEGFVSAMVLYEVTLHNTFTRFVRAVASTWEADSKPYDPDAFLTQELDLAGVRDTSGELEPLNVCLNVVRRPSSGRQGHIFYRGVLSQADTVAPSGILQLADVTAMSTLLADAVTAGGIDSYLGIGASAFSLVMINKTGTEGRSLRDLVVGGVSLLPVDHAWFNRTHTP